MDKTKSIILAISAASGVILGLKTLGYLLENNYKVELIISERAYFIFEHELNLKIENDKNIIKETVLQFLKCQDKAGILTVWLNHEVWASPASGSYESAGMIISPTSMSTVASISCGLSDNLIERTADVMIKEDKPLVLVPRETPLSAIHLGNLHKLAQVGVKIVPPMLGFYNQAKSIDDAINFVVGKTLDAFKIDNDIYKRWNYE